MIVRDRYRSLLAELGRALHPHHASAGRRFFVIRLYVDTSGDNRTPVMVAAGYLATETQWRRFERAWGSILRDAGVTEFHATDFFNCHGAFKNWKNNSPEHVQFARRFLGAAVKHTGAAYASGIEVGAMEEELGVVHSMTRTPHGRYTALMLCTMMCLGRAARFGLGPYQKAAVIFEEGDGVGEAIDYLNFLKRKQRGWILSYVSFTTMSKAERPLQAADLLAHETWKRLTSLLAQSERPPRKSFLRLLEGNEVTIQLLTRTEMREAAPKIREYLENNPHYRARG